MSYKMASKSEMPVLSFEQIVADDNTAIVAGNSPSHNGHGGSHGPIFFSGVVALLGSSGHLEDFWLGRCGYVIGT